MIRHCRVSQFNSQTDYTEIGQYADHCNCIVLQPPTETCIGARALLDQSNTAWIDELLSAPRAVENLV
jgi:hypothetical protein